MSQWVTRIQELLDACQQILDHMELPSSSQFQVEELRHLINSEREELTHYSDEHDTAIHLNSLRNSVEKMEQLNEQLIAYAEQRYSDASGGAAMSFEAQPLEDQLHQEEAYHGKIDYKSCLKLKENLEKIHQELG
nr:hypothetical protein [Aneurinibacillus sp. XH2]